MSSRATHKFRYLLPLLAAGVAVAAEAVDEELLKDLDFYLSMELTEFFSMTESSGQLSGDLSVVEKMIDDASSSLGGKEQSHETK